MKLPLLFTNSFSRLLTTTKIRDWFNPQQRWLTRAIPREYTDKSELVPLVLFAILINFVEEEDGLAQLDVDWTSEISAGHATPESVATIKADYTLLRLAYNYAKIERAELIERLHDIFPPMSSNTNLRWIDAAAYQEKYAESDHLETLIRDRDQWAMGIIVKYVDILWT